MPTKQTIAVAKYESIRPWLQTLKNVRSRCSNPKNPKFKYYGGRGIKSFLTRGEIKEVWFRDKAEHMVQPSIDRIDSQKGYFVDNVRFIEMSENRKRRFSS